MNSLASKADIITCMGLISLYQQEREPDLTLQCNFINHVRVEPFLKEMHSVEDFIKWLKTQNQ